MSEMAICYLCERQITDTTGSRVKICSQCSKEYPYLSLGLQTSIKREKRERLSSLGQGIGWYSLTGFDYTNASTESEQKTAYLSADETIDPEVALKDLEEAILEFGMERSLTYLLIHSIHSEYIDEMEHIPMDNSGIPAQMFRFGFGYAMTLVSSESTAALEQPSEKYVSEFPSDYRMIIQSLRKVMAAFSSKSYRENEIGIGPEEDINRLQVMWAVQHRELTVSRMAFHRQYLEAVDRQYSPFHS